MGDSACSDLFGRLGTFERNLGGRSAALRYGFRHNNKIGEIN